MGIASKAGDWVFKIFTAGLGGATIFFGANLSLNVYRGKKWNTAQSKIEEASNDHHQNQEKPE